MKTLFLLAVGTALGMGTASMLHTGHPNQFAGPSATAAQNIAQNITQNNDAAFRDGLYLGRIAAQAGAAPYIAIARWSTAEDRASFTTGYQRGYNEVLASRLGS
jgi:hypothetical protein